MVFYGAEKNEKLERGGYLLDSGTKSIENGWREVGNGDAVSSMSRILEIFRPLIRRTQHCARP